MIRRVTKPEDIIKANLEWGLWKEVTAQEKCPDGIIVTINGGHRRLIRNQRALNRAYASTKGLPIEHPQVVGY